MHDNIFDDFDEQNEYNYELYTTKKMIKYSYYDNKPELCEDGKTPRYIYHNCIYNSKGKLHSKNCLPSTIITIDEYPLYVEKIWHKHNNLHRENNMPAHIIESEHYRCKRYYNNGKFHNIFGPSIICNHGDKYGIDKYYYFDDKLHNIKGPAIYNNKSGTKKWYIHGNEFTEDFVNNYSTMLDNLKNKLN